MKSTFLLLILYVTVLLSCSKTGHKVYNPPTSLLLLIKDKGVRLGDDTLNNLKLAYIKDNDTTYVDDFFRFPSSGIPGDSVKISEIGIMSTRNIGILSGDQNIKTYYIIYPDLTKDTLVADYSSGNSNYHLNRLLFNNREPDIDTIDGVPYPVYILNK